MSESKDRPLGNGRRPLEGQVPPLEKTLKELCASARTPTGVAAASACKGLMDRALRLRFPPFCKLQDEAPDVH